MEDEVVRHRLWRGLNLFVIKSNVEKLTNVRIWPAFGTGYRQVVWEAILAIARVAIARLSGEKSEIATHIHMLRFSNM